jgi:hypothetical protein
MKKPRCDWCSNVAHYEHLHIMEPAEYACLEHWSECKACKPLTKKAKYQALAKES